ncbi:DUF2237 domain-containing protein [uncultured Nevskia sp.]|uniref:DUF2237 family protein n=1 Tax=uncultured Nevskia sp. TaxID=228950 RepID=UPI0025FDEFD7|nr:DUF2237 domain-containing protein [uncultured Nevskia sp.]
MAADASSSSGPALNVFGELLACCCTNPMTGFYRDGNCRTGPQDVGRHLVCAQVTTEFLKFSRSRGNDLSTPRPEYDFPGLKDGDRWCLCALRWLEAYEVGMAPPVLLAATHLKALQFVPRAALDAHALDRR